MNVVRNATCRMCDCTEFSEVIDLGHHPLVNSLVRREDLHKTDPTFPLVVRQCKGCDLVQLTDIIDAHEIYKNVDYLFFSSDMPGLAGYFGEYGEELVERFHPGFVVEIGSNDGVLLSQLQSRTKVLGVDPATNVVLRALKRGVPTVPLFFSEELAEKIRKEWGTADVITGANCIAHLNDLRDLMRGVKKLLADDGVFVVECNYWGGMVKNTNYSLIYHDHYSYFSLRVWQEFAAKYGMSVFDATVTPAQGGSLRLFLNNGSLRAPTDRLFHLEKQERETELNTYETSLRYRANVRATAAKLRDTLLELKRQGKIIAGYGAAAKGFTILKCSEIGADVISYFVDDSPAKQGWFTPVDHIPIITRDEANAQLPDYFIILAPNYANVILDKEVEYRKAGGKFILPVGDIRIV